MIIINKLRIDSLRPGMMTDESSSSNPTGGLIDLRRLAAAFHTPTLDIPNASRLEYLFEEEYLPNGGGPSWGSRICYGAGTTYLSGLAVGGAWGLLDGLRNRAGRTSMRLRWNCIVNACTARGPFVANSAGMVALLYNLIHGGVIKVRGGRFDEWTAVGSATAAGLLFKSTAGLRTAGLAALLAGSLMSVYQWAPKVYQENFLKH